MDKYDDQVLRLIGQRIRELRFYSRISQTEFGERIGGANQKLVTEWENGKRLISTKYLMRIQNAFGISLNYFDVLPKSQLCGCALQDKQKRQIATIARNAAAK